MWRVTRSSHKDNADLTTVVWQSEQRWSQKQKGMAKLKEIVKGRRLRWLGHVIRTEDCWIPNQALNWNFSIMNRKSGRPRKNWQDTIRSDLKDIRMTWDDASEFAHSRSSWRQRVAQCVSDTGWTQVSGFTSGGGTGLRVKSTILTNSTYMYL